MEATPSRGVPAFKFTQNKGVNTLMRDVQVEKLTKRLLVSLLVLYFRFIVRRTKENIFKELLPSSEVLNCMAANAQKFSLCFSFSAVNFKAYECKIKLAPEAARAPIPFQVAFLLEGNSVEKLTNSPVRIDRFVSSTKLIENDKFYMQSIVQPNLNSLIFLSFVLISRMQVYVAVVSGSANCFDAKRLDPHLFRAKATELQGEWGPLVGKD